MSAPAPARDAALEAITEEILARIERMHALDTPQRRAVEMLRCERDVVYWASRWVWTFDPRLEDPWPSHLPMILWPSQVDLLRWLHERRQAKQPGLIKKSRDVGVTWICVVYAVWAWLYEPGFVGAFGSRKEALVDKLGDPSSIFGKARILIDKLPAWMLPPGFKRSEHLGFLKITNPHSGAILTGESGDEMGRGGRSTMYFIDEAGFIPRADVVDAAISANTNVPIYLSTSGGIGTSFYRKEKGGRYPVFYMSWRSDPRKDEAWAERERLRDAVIFAREYDMDDAAALDGMAIPARWVEAAIGLDLDIGFTARAGLDVSDAGADLNVLIVRRGACTTRVESWTDTDTTQTAHKSATVCVDEGCDLYYDRSGVGAGVNGELSRVPRTFEYEGIDNGSKPTSTRYPDDTERPAYERFANLSTEMWWSLRLRFKRTWEHVHGLNTNHAHEDMISLPPRSVAGVDVLVAQLSSRLIETDDKGKIKLESKRDMRRRGVKSPDYADALVLAYCNPVRIASSPITFGVGGGVR